MKIKTITPKRGTIKIVRNITIAILICFTLSYFEFKSQLIGILFLMIIVILFIKEYSYKTNIIKISAMQNGLIKFDMIKNGKREEIDIYKDNLLFEFKKILHGKMLNLDYHIYLRGLDEEIKLTSYQGWNAKELKEFLDENGVGYRII